ncbi:MAG: histidine kinase [Candidatus Zixiibacteriota bacterium]|nr:MAG: histidine kinase [candidate division Zixibacteria bacterium]
MKKKTSFEGPLPFPEDHYRDLKRRHVIRLVLTYLAPLLILIIYFYFQYNAMLSESRRLHLKAIAENQANTLDLFLSERLVNLSNLIDDPKFPVPPSPGSLEKYLEKLAKNSETFVDIGYFDSTGVQVSYVGPYPSLENRNYSSEPWYQALRDEDFVITDIYLGFRQLPHFTIAVRRIIDNHFVVLRSALSPGRIYDYMASLEGANEVLTSIVNRAGYYQLVTPHIGTPLESSSIVPPDHTKLGVEDVNIGGDSFTYGYSWLKTADWALIVQWAHPESEGFLSGMQLRLVIISSLLIFFSIFMILYRSRRLVEFQIESDRTRAQLEHAAKLASVGELAAGIAHEINNPLAVICEEAGLMKDLMDPEFGTPHRPEELTEHLDNIEESVFRCRDITGKLLGFVRQTDMDLREHDIHEILDDVVDGILGPEMAVSNIEVIRDYQHDIPRLVTDKNQLQQVILNIINNAVDAIGGLAGRITITTSNESKNARIAIADTGGGISPELLDKIFLPFFTTKEVGRGTGLGLSVSYGIIKSLGGKIEVESSPGEGSTFSIVLPYKDRKK